MASDLGYDKIDKQYKAILDREIEKCVASVEPMIRVIKTKEQDMAEVQDLNKKVARLVSQVELLGSILIDAGLMESTYSAAVAYESDDLGEVTVWTPPLLPQRFKKVGTIERMINDALDAREAKA